MTVGEFIKKFRLLGLQAFKRYYSFYPGTVVDNKDPQKRNRIRLRCPAVWGTTAPQIWAPELGRFKGSYIPPAIGSEVMVQFQEGDPSHPYWFHYSAQPIVDAAETKYIFRTSGGLEMTFDDLAKTIVIKQAEGLFSVSVDNDGISIQNNKGQSLKKSLDDMNDGIKAITVGTPLGNSTVPINQATFDSILSEISQYLK